MKISTIGKTLAVSFAICGLQASIAAAPYEITPDYVTQAELALEATNRIIGDGEVLQQGLTLLNSEAAARAAGDADLQGQVAAESAAREAGDAGLQSQMDNAIASGLSLINDETVAREAGDAGLQGQMDSAIAEGQSLIGDLQSQLSDAIATGVSYAETETAERIAGDAAVQGDLDATKTQGLALLEEAKAEGLALLEATKAEGLDLLSDAVSQGLALAEAEEQARIAGDAAVQSDLDAFKTAGLALADSVISDLDSEVNARASGDQDLQNQINFVGEYVDSVTDSLVSVKRKMGKLRNSNSSPTAYFATQDGKFSGAMTISIATNTTRDFHTYRCMKSNQNHAMCVNLRTNELSSTHGNEEYLETGSYTAFAATGHSLSIGRDEGGHYVTVTGQDNYSSFYDIEGFGEGEEFFDERQLIELH